MKPVPFKEQTHIIAENQEPYLPLPALIESDGNILTCWKLSFVERLAILFSGRVWIQTLTFHKPLQPIQASVKNPIRNFSMWGILSLEDRLAVILMAPTSMLLIHLFSRFLTWCHVWKWVQILLVLVAFFTFPWYLMKAYRWATKKK